MSKSLRYALVRVEEEERSRKAGKVRLMMAVVSSLAEGEALLARVRNGTVFQGQDVGFVSPSDLDPRLADAVKDLKVGEVSKETTHAIQTLLTLQEQSYEDVEATLTVIMSQAHEIAGLSYWDSDRPDDMQRGPVFATRWVILGLLQASDYDRLNANQYRIMDKAVTWLCTVQMDDGAWAKIVGDPLQTPVQWYPTGPGIVMYGILAIGAWLRNQ